MYSTLRFSFYDSEEERIPCIFRIEGKSMGHLDTLNDLEDLPEGSRVELPLWLACALHEQNIVHIELPKHFEKKMRDEMSAGASNINLRDYSHYFFEVGMKLATETSNADLREILTTAFSGNRFEELMVHALSRLLVI